MVAGFTVAGCFSVFLRYEVIGTGYLPRGTVFFLFILLLLNALLRRFAQRWQLSRKELLVIFAVMLGMAGIPGQDFAQHLYLNLLGMVNYSGQGQVANLNVLDHVPAWLIPARNASEPVILHAYTGLPDGIPVPYRAWLAALTAWTPYIFLVYWTLVCSAAMLFTQWEKRERLLFPLMQVPLEIVDTADGQASPLWKNKLLWAGFIFSTMLYVFRGLHSYYPAFPDVLMQSSASVRFAGGNPLFPTGPMTAFNGLLADWYPDVTGIAYLLSSEVGFSLWFFYFLRLVITTLRISWGVTTPHADYFNFQTFGAYLVLAIAILWSARGHLTRVVRVAFSRGEDAGNPMPYRVAFWGMALGIVSIVLWCRWIGISWWAAALMFLLHPLIGIVVSRVICEGGLFLYSSPFRLNEMLFRTIGTANLGAQNVTLMHMVHWVDIRNTSAQAMPFIMQAYKIGSESKVNPRFIAGGIVAGIFLSVLISHVASLYVIYHSGIGKLAQWPRNVGQNSLNSLAGFLNNPQAMNAERYQALGIGGAGMIFLVLMRQRFLWWPFHPLGFIAWMGWPTERYWLSIFLGWLIKIFVLRFGGYKVFNTLRPFFFGLTLGICFILTFWTVFHFILPGPELIAE
jgi:hypothetical protein